MKNVLPELDQLCGLVTDRASETLPHVRVCYPMGLAIFKVMP